MGVVLRNVQRLGKWARAALIVFVLTAVVPFLVLFLALVAAVQTLKLALGYDRVDVMPAELVSRLKKFVDGTFDVADYEDMTERFKDADLEAIRLEFMKIKFPINELDRERLRELIAGVEAKNVSNDMKDPHPELVEE